MYRRSYSNGCLMRMKSKSPALVQSEVAQPGRDSYRFLRHETKSCEGGVELLEGERLDEPHAADHAGAEAHGNWTNSSRILVGKDLTDFDGREGSGGAWLSRGRGIC
jgi:hypothetical protein